MSGPLTALAKAGDAWDATVTAIAATPGRTRAALAVRGPRRAALIAGALTLVVYLFSIGDLTVSGSGRLSHAPALRAAPEQLFQARAPYLFEPVLAWQPTGHVAVLLSPVNLALGGLVAALVGANLAVAVHAAHQAVSCRRTRYARLAAVFPAFLLGFACCVPTFLLVLGAGTAAALLPVLVPLRPVFYPLALALLTGTLVWGAARAGRAAGRAGDTGDTGDTGDAAAPSGPGTPDA
ncbi:hypothetical protein [Streptomyces sp. JJ38]|uniref:hypothetical protein n=1 Tax=Streptomyces sp. JJ38 TaxID=2738128 RepID=UPI00214BBB39|nr:hypothetical protein [Streptomyces sp. JJ38]